jgi:hypothetical protein
MKKFLLLLCLVASTVLAADVVVDKSFLQELEQKAKTIALTVPPAEKLLPADTLGFLTVPDWAKAQASFTNSATGQLWADPAMKGFKEAFFDKFNAEKIQPLEKELGFQFTNFLNLTRGQFTLGVVPNGWDGRSERQPGVLWLMDAKENASQLRTNLADLRKKWTESGRKMRTEKIRDVEFTVVIVDAQEIGKSLQQLTPGPKAQGAADEPTATRTVEWVIGQSGPLLVVSDAAKDVEKVLALQSGVAVPALAEQAAFAASAGMLRNAQSFAWINVKPIMATLARKPAERPGEQQSLLGAMPTMDKVLSAFGLNGVQSIAFNWQQAAEGSTANIAVRVPESGRKGLFNILAVDAKDASAPLFVPADAVKFSRWRIDLQKAWSTIETVLLEVSPQYAGFSKLILDTAGKDKDPNFDFRKQLLANMGDDVISYEKAPRAGAGPAGQPPSAPSLTLVGSKNAAQMAASLRAVTSIFPPEMIKYSERDFLGRKIYSVVIPSMGADNKPRPLTYAASGGYVAFSTDAATLEEYLRSGEGNVKPLRELPGLNEAVQNVGGTGSGYFSFQNQTETARAAFDAAKTDPAAITELLGAGQLTTILGMLGGDGKSTADLIDATKLPTFEKVAKYFHFDVSAIGVTPDAITFKTFTPTPPALRK